jgi:hypothetical protein
MVKVTVEVPPDWIIAGLKTLLTVGVERAFTDKVAELLPGPAVGVCIDVTPDVEFGLMPLVLLVTLKITVQVPLAGMVIPLKLRAVAPAESVLGVVPVQEPPTAPPTALMLTRVSDSAPLVS